MRRLLVCLLCVAGCDGAPEAFRGGALATHEGGLLSVGGDGALVGERSGGWRVGSTTLGAAAVGASWAAGDGRVAQSFVLDARAPGATARVWTELSGDTAPGADGSLWSRGTDGALRIWGLRAWDAAGRDVPGRLAGGAGGYAIELAHGGMEYPLTIDPYLAPMATWSASGPQVHSAAGMAVAMGDFDGDGSLDAAVGLPGWDGPVLGSGAVQIHYGLVGSPTVVTLEGTEPYGWFGAAVAVLDADGDGIDDLAIGAPGDGTAGGFAGAVRLFSGDAGGLSPAGVWLGSGPGWELGAALHATDDVDGDGLPELLAGAPGAGPDARGAAWLLSPADPALPPVVRVGADPGGRFGAALWGGDLDGNAWPDLVVGAPLAPPGGSVSLFVGGASGWSTQPDWTSYRPEPAAQLGAAIAVLDLDTSGIPELVVGAPGAGGGPGAIEVFVDGPGSGLAVSLDGPAGNGQMGASLAAGDLDGDGVIDLLVGRPGAGAGASPLAGGMMLFPGGPSAPSGSVRHDGTLGYSRFGVSIATADVDGDGLDDVLVGGFLATLTGVVQAGAAWLMPGLSADADADADGYCDDAGPCSFGVPGGDCDDSDPTRNPGAVELCDGSDGNCDGVVPTGELDGDGDGFSPCAGDCADGDANIHPLANEQCDFVDHDCDGLTSNNVDPLPRYEDADGDGVGAGTPVVFGCDPPGPGLSVSGLDCNDNDPAVFPGAGEIACNGVDDDCEPWTEDARDGDGDGALPCEDCSRVGGSWVCGDCDDASALVRPGTREQCEDGIDQDCDGSDAACEVPVPCLEPDNLCEEPSGCNAARGSGSPGVLLLCLVALLARGRRLPIGALLAAALLAGSAHAQVAWDADGKLDTQLLRPSFAPWSFVGSSGAEPGLAGTVRVGVVTQYEHAPMVLFDDNEEVASILRHRVTHTVGAWVSPVDRLGFGLALPLVFHEADWTEGDWELAPAALGDLEVDALFRLVRSGSGALAVGARVWMPTASVHSLAGESLPRVEGRLAVQGSVGPITGLIEARALLRKRIHTGYDLDLASEFILLGALRAWPVPGRMQVAVEAESRGSTAGFLKPGAANPLDLRGVVRLHPTAWLTLEVGGGLGLNRGYGAPRARGLVGMSVRRLPRRGGGLEPWSDPDFVVATEPDEVFEPEEFDLLDEPDELVVFVDESDDEEEPPVPEVLAEVTELQIVIHEPIDFAFDSDELLDTSLPVLTEVARLMGQHPELAHVLIEGHASLEGRTDYNWDLSNRRAAAVFRWLAEAGVSTVRLSYRGMGEAVPKGDRGRSVIREQDRRVEFHIVERLDTLLDAVPDWDAEAPPVPWLMDDPDVQEVPDAE